MLSKGFDKKVRSYFLIVSLLLFPSGVFAKDAISLYLENDSRILKPNHNTDRHYTHGTKLVYLTQPQWKWLDDFSKWHFADAESGVDTAVGFFLGQNIYTPDHVDEPAKRSDDDRVFAGWLYTGMFAQRATDNSDDPIGWDEQLSDEFAIDLTFMRKQRLQDGWFKPTESTDFITEYGFTAGSVHRHLQAGVTFRYGFNLDNTFGPGRLAMPSGISTLRKDETAQSGYFFVRATGKAIEHNRFLTGLDAEPLMGEFAAGVVYQYKKLEIGYSQTFFTQEFEEQSGKDSFGALTVSWKF
ncbi:MAG: lipid A deacylase LpxR family protein [Planctomycetota bacterium]|jgi:hypothetical protein